MGHEQRSITHAIHRILKCQVKQMNFKTAEDVKNRALHIFVSTPEESFSNKIEKLKKKQHLNEVILLNSDNVV